MIKNGTWEKTLGAQYNIGLNKLIFHFFRNCMVTGVFYLCSFICEKQITLHHIQPTLSKPMPQYCGQTLILSIV